MASQSQGIQQLLQAEKRAAEKVAEARKREYGPVGLRRGGSPARAASGLPRWFPRARPWAGPQLAGADRCG